MLDWLGKDVGININFGGLNDRIARSVLISPEDFPPTLVNGF